MEFLKHLALAAILSFGLSLGFWAVFGVFDLRGFWVVSTACALIGALGGYLAGKRLAATTLLTVIVRVAVFALVVQGG